ncbi:hypothetical protein ABGF35_08100, partial [Helcococcus ovis]|uniref:hypothetical protein n=2 Tax=Helcococcus ovis TaxID=72026 RepID=UPI0038B86FFA
ILVMSIIFFSTSVYASGRIIDNSNIQPYGVIIQGFYNHKEKIYLYGSHTISNRIWRRIYISDGKHKEGYYQGYIFLKTIQDGIAYFEGTLDYAGNSALRI